MVLIFILHNSFVGELVEDSVMQTHTSPGPTFLKLYEILFTRSTKAASALGFLQDVFIDEVLHLVLLLSFKLVFFETPTILFVGFWPIKNILSYSLS